MFKLLQSLAIVFVFSGIASAQEGWAWKTFSPAGGAWSITAPGPMRPDAEAQQADSTKGSYSYNDFYGFFAVIYRDSPKRWVPWKPDYNAYFKKVRNDIVKAGNGQLLKEEDFSAGGLTGREVLVKIPAGTMTGAEGQTVTKYRVQRFRMFFNGRRFYMLLAVLPEDIVSSEPVNNYFNSFAAK